MIRSCLIFLLLFFISNLLHAQDPEPSDTVGLYRKIEDFSNKRKITQILYGAVFRPVSPRPQPVKAPVQSSLKVKSYKQFEGKIIRYINIETYDPFGYDTKDTSRTPTNILQKASNGAHIKTMPYKIKNLLIIKKFDTFDSLRVKESERLIREQNYVREVFISPALTEHKDSVDIFIRVYDVWSIIITGYGSPTNLAVYVKDKNFLGTGDQLENRYIQNFVNGQYSNETNYNVTSIYNTHISSLVHYKINEDKSYTQGISFDRPFYSVFTSYAGGASFEQQVSREVLYDPDSTSFLQKYKFNTQDCWFGRSFPLVRGHSEDQRTTTLITSLRYRRVNYVETSPRWSDSLRYHVNENFYLYSIGVIKRQYKQDNYIFKYGYTEDVPTGRSYSVVTGYQIRDNIGRWYLGSRLYMANYHSWGYFNLYAECGTFFRNARQEEGNITVGTNYFSNIIKIGKWKLRQFIKPELTFGFNRLPQDNLSLNNEGGIHGFNSTGLTGTQKGTLTFQLQSYAPWNVLGFRFGPYIICSFGMLGDEARGFKRSPVYSSFGIGILVKNEYLVLNTFQISFAYYPIIPGEGSSLLKLNPVKTTDFGFRGFDITRPSTISYQ